MAKIGIFYGSTTGVCEDIANRIAAKTGGDVFPCTEIDKAPDYDVILLGSSTWGAGEVQDDWYDAMDSVKAMNLSGKKVALFSVGDSSGYSDTFCGALAPLYDSVKDTGAEICPGPGIEGYTFDASEGVMDGKWLGLALDETNEPHLTDARIDSWIASAGL